MLRGAGPRKSTYVLSHKSPYIEEMDADIQKFLFKFIPALFKDISENIDDGFSELQIKKINQYFHEIRTLSAIAHPHRLYWLFGQLTHVRIRRLHDHFKSWCESCSSAAVPRAKREKLLEKMEDALARLSHGYRIASGMSLTDEQQRLVHTVTMSMNDTIKGLTRIGLKSVDAFVEMSMGMPGTISSSKRRYSQKRADDKRQ
jgi:hypothetical protein